MKHVMNQHVIDSDRCIFMAENQIHKHENRHKRVCRQLQQNNAINFFGIDRLIELMATISTLTWATEWNPREWWSCPAHHDFFPQLQ